jgi:hypothetical protein
LSGWLAIGAWLFSSWQSDIDAVRRGRARSWLVPLAACLPMPDAPPQWRAEALRRRRLSPRERQMTLWAELDAVTLDGNVDERSIIWPRSSEAWSDETGVMPAVEKRCEAGAPASLKDELLLIAGAADTPVRRYHVALLRYRLELPTSLSREELPSLLVPDRDLLLAEQAPGDGSVFEALEDTHPDIQDALRVRSLAVALGQQNETLVTRVLDRGVSAGTPAYANYFLAVRVFRLQRAAKWSALIDAALAGFPRTTHDDENAELVREAVAEALVMTPFSRTTTGVVAALHGEGRVAREIYRLGSLALSKGQWGFARDAFAWTLEHAKVLAPRAHAKLASLALTVGDVAMLDTSLHALGEDKPQALPLYDALLVQIRAGSVAGTKVLPRLATAVASYAAKHKKDGHILEVQADLARLMKRTNVPLILVVAPEPSAAVPVAPEVRFELREPVALIEAGPADRLDDR